MFNWVGDYQIVDYSWKVSRGHPQNSLASFNRCGDATQLITLTVSQHCLGSNNGVYSPPITELDMVPTQWAYRQIGQRLDANKHQEDVSNHREEDSVN